MSIGIGKKRIAIYFVPREAEHGNLTLVETDIGNHFAVGTEVESAVERELFR